MNIELNNDIVLASLNFSDYPLGAKIVLNRMSIPELANFRAKARLIERYCTEIIKERTK